MHRRSFGKRAFAAASVGLAASLRLGHALSQSLDPDGGKAMPQKIHSQRPNSAVLSSKDLQVVIGDNAATADHLAGYNGIWSLTHRNAPTNVFASSFAGFNLNHIFNGMVASDDPGFFEPRQSPMQLILLDNQTAELYQPPTPTLHVESRTRFRLLESDGIDFSFRAVPHADVFPHDYLEFFWSSYMGALEDKSIYFLGRPAENRNNKNGERYPAHWQQLCTSLHGRDSVVCQYGHRTGYPSLAHGPDTLAGSLSPITWDQSFFYGRNHDMWLLVMLDLQDQLRFIQSPVPGGYTPEAATYNPAWDFQLIVSEPRVGETYGFDGRIVYRHCMSRQDILAEWDKFNAP